MLLYLSLAVCACIAAAIVYRYDMYDREPPAAALIAVALGALAMWLAGHLELRTLQLTGPAGMQPRWFALIAAVEEEAAKLAVVILMAALFRRTFNDPMDGLIYGSLAGLGAAIEESVHVLSRSGETGPVIPPAEIIRILGHLVMGGIGGYGVGLAVHTTGLARRLARTAPPFLAAVALHYAWDVIALAHEGPLGPPRWHGPVASVIMLAGLALYGRFVVLGSRRSREHFNAPPRRIRGLWTRG